MIVDSKQPPNEKAASAAAASSSTTLSLGSGVHHSPPDSQAKLSVELPTPPPIYTNGSLVSGIVHLYRKDPESVQEIQVSIVCCVRSIYVQSYGNSQDFRQETTRLFHRDTTLWSRSSPDEILPNVLPFEIRIPDSGIDSKANDNSAVLPPSFYAKKHGWSKKLTSSTTNRGFVKYYVKARLVRKGFLKLNETAVTPFAFLPPSGPPPLLPTPPDNISDQELDQLKASWVDDTISVNVRHHIFNSRGRAVLSLWLPRVEKLPRETSIPFFLSLLLRTNPSQSQERPSNGSLPSPHLDKVSVYLQRTLRVCANKGEQTHTKTYDKDPTDNFMHSLIPQESDWKCITSASNDTYWEKGYIWRGRWKFKETPNFTNRQLTMKYFLVAKVPMKGLGNDIKLTSRELDISTGVLAGEISTMAGQDWLPGYFEAGDGSDVDEQDEKN